MAQTQTQLLSEDFLRSQAPHITVSRLDFTKEGLPEYEGLYAVVLDSVLSPDECKQLLKAAEATTNGSWERAMINVGNGQQKLITDARNCGRIIWDSHDIVDRVWKRIEQIPEVQEITLLENAPKVFGNGPAKRNEVWKFTRPNERMRFLKYVGGEYFRPHQDGSYQTEDGKERSYYTLHLYLNDAEDVEGGATVFHPLYLDPITMDSDHDVHVKPKPGRILLFQHRNLIHSGADVESGVKYTMRTDLMYTIESTESKTKSFMRTLIEPKRK